DQRRAVVGRVGLVHVGRPPDVAVLDAAQDRVLLLSLDDHAAGALGAVASPVVDPRLAEHLPAESLFVILLLVVPAVLGVGLARPQVEGVSRGAQADHRLARLDVIDDVLHLLVGQVAEAREDDHQVGGLQRLQAGDVLLVVRVDRAVRIDGEQDGALETVMFGQDLGQLRQRLLGAVLLVAADQDDVLAFARPVAAFDHQPRVVRPYGRTRQHGQRQNRPNPEDSHRSASHRRILKQAADVFRSDFYGIAAGLGKVEWFLWKSGLQGTGPWEVPFCLDGEWTVEESEAIRRDWSRGDPDMFPFLSVLCQALAAVPSARRRHAVRPV